MTNPKPAPNTEPVERKENLLRKTPTADDCQRCGLGYCDCEVCDDSGTVPPAKD